MNRLGIIVAVLSITVIFIARYARHKHKWEKITVGRWEEIEPKYLFDGTEVEPPLQYRWQRKELVYCKCGVTHERMQLSTGMNIKVVE
jgi:hypothetical protein